MEKMKKVSLWVRYGNAICLIFWIIIFSAWVVFACIDAKIWITNGLLMILLTWTIWCFIQFMKWVQEMEAIDRDKQEKLLERLNSKYSNYILLVNTVLDEELSKYKDGIPSFLDVNRDIDYLIVFEKKKKWVRENKVGCKPDSFIIAACMLYALMEKPRIISKDKDVIIECEDMKRNMNLNIAVECAKRIISEPVTYFRDFMGEWQEEKHPKVKIVVPKGIIRDEKFSEQIMQTLYDDEVSNNRTSIMQLANMFQLIYIYSKERAERKKR